MDQVKKVMGLVFAQRFWILCGLVTLLPVGGWFTTTSQMREFTAGRKTAIDQKISAAKALAAKQSHPNDASHKSMDELRNRITQRVADAWTLQYERQKELLVWPKGLLPDFIKIVDKIRPLEIVQPPATPTDEVLNRELRERYRNYIAQELPKLAKKIGATWQVQELVEGSDPNAGMQPGVPGGPGVDATGRPLVNDKVVWSPTDQAALRNRYDWSTTAGQVPRTIDVLYAQEDLWVMSALMDVIAKTNEAATGRYNAIVKDISYISLGREVGGSTGQVLRANAVGGQGGMMGGGMMGEGGMMGGSGMMSMGAAGMGGSGGSDGASSAAGMAGAAAGMAGIGGADGGIGMSGMTSMGGGMTGGQLDPAENRYVDPDYKPVPASTLRTAITSDSQDPANAFLVVAKRIPIRLGLTVDQRKLNRFITACGNAPLMVEVRQVRFNRQSGPSAAGGMGGGMMGGGMGSMMGGMGMSSMGGMGGLAGGGMSGDGYGGGGMGGMQGMMGGEGGYGSTDTNQAGSDVSPHDKPVEIYGVVYIYNPVNVKKLGIENKEVEETPPAIPAPAEVPPAAAAAPPAGAPPAEAPGGAAAGGAAGGIAAPPAGAPPAAAAPGAAGAPPVGGVPAGAAPDPGAAGAVVPPAGAPGQAAPAGAPAPAPGN